jgi:uncharacterized protein (DUF2235 family)
MRRLVICADGTWKSDDDKQPGGKARTNVVKLREAIPEKSASGIEQRRFYDPGVGADGGWFSRLVGGGTGQGLSENVRDCYTYLIDNFEPGDELFFFGFSRGAFTVRSLAGLVRKCGILPRDDKKSIGDAYDFYRKRGEEFHPASPAAVKFRATHRSRETTIKCLGVWDTVGSLGVPTAGPIGMFTRHRYGFHDVRLSSSVENAFHALAIDERRKPFAPALWTVREKDVQKDAHQRIEQRWFAGVHSNVGGGYADCGLSDLTLKWMLERAQECGLEIKPGVLEGLKCDCAGKLEDSMTTFYRAFGPFERKIGEPQRDPETGEALLTFEDVDDTVRERHSTVKPPYATPGFIRYWQQNPSKWPPHQPPAATR